MRAVVARKVILAKRGVRLAIQRTRKMERIEHFALDTLRSLHSRRRAHGTGALTTGGRAVALCEVGTDGLRLHSLPDEQRQCNHRRRLE